jgi:hypothetical protein
LLVVVVHTLSVAAADTLAAASAAVVADTLAAVAVVADIAKQHVC